MANEGREFSFSTRQYKLGEVDMAFEERNSISTKTNLAVEEGVAQPDYTYVPDSGNLQANWDVSEQPEADGQVIGTLVDQSGNGNDAVAVSDPMMDVDGFNGKPAPVLDGSDDRWEVEMTLSQPFTVYSVVSLAATDGSARTIMRDSGPNFVLDYYDPRSNWRVYAGSSVSGSSNQDPELIVGVLDGANSLIIEDGTQTGSGDAGTGESTDLGIGARFGGNASPWNGLMMQHLIYGVRHGEAMRSDIMNYLADRWGITL